MAQRIFDRDARALGESNDEDLRWRQAAILAGIDYQPIGRV